MTRSRQHEVSYVDVHGHRRAFVQVGSGPALLLLHGLGCDHTTWNPVIDRLAETHTVIAPDLLGHGLSDKPRADYSVGGYANGMRDLLSVLGIERVTVVGHSLGGGVAMQFAYQYPERTERLLLVSPGGLGREVTPLIRCITTPGFHQVMGVLTRRPLRQAITTSMRVASAVGPSLTHDLDEVAEIVDTFADPRARAATRHVVSAVVDWKGQIITMTDRAYLTRSVPTLIVWGTADHVIPARHAARAQAAAPGIRVALVEGAGHFPHKDDPQRFAELVEDFLATTEPARFNRGVFRAMLRAGSAAPAGTALAAAPTPHQAPIATA